MAFLGLLGHLQAEEAPPAPILCIGDSLTFGEGGKGVSYPGVLAARSGIPTVNLGLSGWIPRHIVYHILLKEVASVTRAQLESVPPADCENRRHQPAIDHLRTFLTEGQTVWVTSTETTRNSVAYRWDPYASDDSAETIKPAAVGDQTHQPFIGSGRWRRTKSADGAAPVPKHYLGIVLWVGANGMEADDVARSLRTLITVLEPAHERFLVLGLMNRVDPVKHPEDVAPWAAWIEECNRTIAAAYPHNYLDLQEWMVRSATGYNTLDWFPRASTEQISADARDQKRGLIPNSLRAPGNTTHFNATGYTVIGTLVDRWISAHGWYSESPTTKSEQTAVRR